MTRKSAASTLAWSCALAVLTVSVALGQALQPAPPNPDFLAYLDARAAGTWRLTHESGFGLGWIPSPVDHRYTLGDRPADQPRNLPQSYDLRNTTGKVPAIRNQGNCGSCWAFSSYASLETSIRPGDTLDCSENHLKNTHGCIPTCCAGGNARIAMAYLARWAGPIREADDPYNAGSCTSPTGLTVQRHVQEAWVLPARTDPTDNNAIKSAIMNYGAVHTAVLANYSAPYYRSDTAAAYYNGTASFPDHSVAIIGWDDNYSRDNFYSTNKPSANGAFLIRNSWGTGYHLSGYYWLSYEDKFGGNVENALFLNADPTANYPTVYQYDPLGWVTHTGYGTTTIWIANRFTKDNTQQQLAAVSFYTNDVNTSYRVYCYKNPNAGGPKDGGTSMLPAPGYVEGSFTYSGFHTVALPPVETLNLATTDTSFSVVIRLVNSSYGYPGCYECDYVGYADADAAPGRSFHSSDGDSWGDLYTFDSSADFCIKAYTYAGPLMVQTLGFQAQGSPGGVRLTWRTANEVSTAGFHVYRAERPSGPFERITTEMIAGRGRGSTGAAYEFTDRTTRPGRVYFYRLQEITESGLSRDCSNVVETEAPDSPLLELLPYGLRDLLAS